MKVTFISNFLNHHQIAISNHLYGELKDNYTFISTIEMPQTFKDSGYPTYNDIKYHFKAYESQQNFKKALEISLNSDIVVLGAAPEIFIKERMKFNKHTFRYAEHFFKKGFNRLLDPRVILNMIKFHTAYRNKNLYMLCASGFTGRDLNLFFAYPKKKFKWGYFIEPNKIDISNILLSKNENEKIKLLWVGRFLDWKHPELTIKLAHKLKLKGYNFSLNIIGSGIMKSELMRLTNKYNLSEEIILLGNLPNEKVKELMLESNIFLFTSDLQEGWGVVLNEAMSSGCAVVVSKKVGASPFLIKNKENGLLFESENLKSLQKNVEILMNDKMLRLKYSKNAYQTISDEWSASSASNNLLLLFENILRNNEIKLIGPCSKN